jgi:hypothetical protein
MVADATGKYAKPPEVAAQQTPKATPKAKPQVAPQATTPAVVTPAPQVSSTANTPVPATAPVADAEFAETQGKWQPHNDKHVSELERMLHLAKYSR